MAHDLHEAESGAVRVEVLSKQQPLAKRIGAYVPIFISVLALVTSVWSAYATRTHNRLSVRPAVGFEREMAGTKSGRAGFSLRNDGFGPARVSKLHLYLDGKPLSHWREIAPALKVALSDLNASGADVEWYEFEGSATLRAGELRPLYIIKITPERSTPLLDELLEKRLFMSVEYCSIYDECNYACVHFDDDACEAELLRLGVAERKASSSIK